MSGVWLIILICYGLSQGWGNIPGLAWWLVLPFILQDMYDAKKRREA